MSILARILKDRGVVTEQQIEEAIQRQVLYGGRLGTSLYELGMITEERLQDALCRANGLPAGSFDPREVEPAAVKLLPKALAERYKVCPYKVKGKTLQLLMVAPRDHEVLAKIGFRLGYIVKPVVVPEFRMLQLLEQHYGIDERWRYQDTWRERGAEVAALDPNDAGERLDAAASRDEIVDALLGACLRFFRRVLFFIVREPWLLGWKGAGGLPAGLVEGLKIPLDKPSVFQRVIRDKTVFLGRFGKDEDGLRLLKALGKKPTNRAALFPVVLKGRVVNLVYGDSGATGNVRAGLGELLVLVQRVPRAYARLIQKRVEEARKLAAAAPA
jgi:type II secretion system (T2SS) protein E